MASWSATFTTMTPHPTFLRASAVDAANAQMRKAGRTAWSEADRDLAVDTLDRLVRACYGRANDMSDADCFLRFQHAESVRQ